VVPEASILGAEADGAGVMVIELPGERRVHVDLYRDNSAAGAAAGTSDSSPSRASRRHVYTDPSISHIAGLIITCVGDAPVRSVSATSASFCSLVRACS
jgi:hypothetical protein